MRLNASHFGIRDLETVAAPLAALPVKVMLDLPGNEYRISGPESYLVLEKGDVIRIGNHDSKYVTDFDAWSSLEPGMQALLQDRGIEARVEGMQDNTAILKIIRGGTLRPKAHLHFPALQGTPDDLSEKDKELIRFAVRNGFAQIVLSHIRHPGQVVKARRFLESVAGTTVPELVVKIETMDAVKHMDALIGLADVLLLGRGDLSAEAAPWEIPAIQRRLIAQCRVQSKPVYIATKVLPSLAGSDAPTRAEVSDLATTLLDGATGITLTDETVLSDDPAKAIEWCKTIIDGVLKAPLHDRLTKPCQNLPGSVP